MIHFGRIPFEDFVALDDIDLDIEEGTTVGILGHNGSGKSTLLKCVAGILQPNEGEIVTRGRLAALLELGAGLPPRAHRPREHLHERVDPRAVEARHQRACSTRSSRSPSSRSSSTCRCGTTRRACTSGSGSRSRSTSIPTSSSSTRCSSVGDEAFQRKCLERVDAVPARRPHDPVRHPRRRPRAPDLRPRHRARPRRAGRRRAARRGGAHVPRVAAALRPRRPDGRGGRGGADAADGRRRRHATHGRTRWPRPRRTG